MRAGAVPAPVPLLSPRPQRHAALTALLEHVAAALAQGHDVVAREHACPVRLVAAARAQRLPARVAEVGGLRVLRAQLSLSPPTGREPEPDHRPAGWQSPRVNEHASPSLGQAHLSVQPSGVIPRTL